MKKALLFIAISILTSQFTFAQKKQAKDQQDTGPKLSKDEEKQLKEELKAYMKNPASYKAKMDEVRANMDADAAQIKALKEDTTADAATLAQLAGKVFIYETQINNLGAENDSLKKTIGLPSAAAVLAPEKGTVYKVQLGMYKGLDLTQYFNEPRFIGYEQVDGMNRYVISYFPDEQTAQNFVADIRKLGIKDAFVSKYIDGTRVYEWDNNPKYKGKKVPDNLEDALQMQEKGKK
jgi:hypothetical protein